MSAHRIQRHGKFLFAGAEKFLPKGVSYGTFAPDARGDQFPALSQVRADFTQMRTLGVNTVRTYTVPGPDILDAAADAGLRLMVGLPWSQHVAFLDDAQTTQQVRRSVVDGVRQLADHPALLMVALGNEIPATVVRWHGQARVEQFLRELHDEAKSAAPDTLFTYVNFPPTEYLELPFLDVCAFNVYLHDETKLRRYLARLQHVAGNLPLLISEAGADSIREGLDGQAELTAMQVRAAFAEGACGAIAFAWTDEWWRGGQDVEDWAFGLVDRQRQPKPAAAAVAQVFADAPFAEAEQPAPGRRCRWWSAPTTPPTRSTTASRSLSLLNYPDYEVILVNDGSKDETEAIALRYPQVRTITTPNHGLSTARNIGLAAATGDDRRLHRRRRARRLRLAHLPGAAVPQLGRRRRGRAQRRPRRRPVAGAVRGPRSGRPDPRAVRRSHRRARARAATWRCGARRSAPSAASTPSTCAPATTWTCAGGCRRAGGTIGFAPSALVWHHHRASVGAFWRQQVGYGEGEVWLQPHHPEKFVGSRIQWRGHVYSPLPFVKRAVRHLRQRRPVGHARRSRRSTASARPRWACCRTPRRGRSPRWCCW